MKRLFGLHRARYFGGAQTYAQTVRATISHNAVDKITLNKRTSEIAKCQPTKPMRAMKLQHAGKHVCLSCEAKNRYYADILKNNGEAQNKAGPPDAGLLFATVLRRGVALRLALQQAQNVLLGCVGSSEHRG